MKEYKKWVMGIASDDWIRDEFTGAEAGWKAALEWAENQFIGKTAFEAEEAINRELRGLKSLQEREW